MAHGKHRKKREPNYKGMALGAAVATGTGIVAMPSPAAAATAAEWERVAQCESAGLWYRSDGHADSTGGLQIQDRTWADFGGTAIAPHAYQATKEQQIMIAEKILAVQGPRAWSVTWNGTCPGATLSRTPYNGGSAPAPKPPAPAPTAPVSEPEDAEDGVYTVRQGDTLSSIAAKLKSDGGWKRLYEINKGVIGADPNVIEVGQKLRLPGHEAPPVSKTGGTYVVKSGDWLAKIAKAKLGAADKWRAIYGLNKSVIGGNPNLIHAGQKFKMPSGAVAEPVQTTPAKPSAPKPAPKPPTSNASYVLPVSGRIGDSLIIGSGGSMSRQAGGHSGLDITAPQGTPVKSAAAGTVVSINSSGGAYGLHVVVKHPSGVFTLYAHLSRISVSVGQSVGAGQQVGNVGSTGNSSGAHLHFEVRNHPTAFTAGTFLNPLTWLRSHGISL